MLLRRSDVRTMLPKQTFERRLICTTSCRENFYKFNQDNSEFANASKKRVNHENNRYNIQNYTNTIKKDKNTKQITDAARQHCDAFSQYQDYEVQKNCENPPRKQWGKKQISGSSFVEERTKPSWDNKEKSPSSPSKEHTGRSWGTATSELSEHPSVKSRFEKYNLSKKNPEDENLEKIKKNPGGIFDNNVPGIHRITTPPQLKERKEDALDEVVETWTKGIAIRLMNLPYSVTAKDIVNFLYGVNIPDGEEGVKFTYTLGGRPSGQAFIQLDSREDLNLALQKHEQVIKKRHIVVQKVALRTMSEIVKRHGKGGVLQTKTGFSIYMTQLPPGTTKEDIIKFLEPFEPVYVFTKILNLHRARVDFASPIEAEDAMCKKKYKMQGRRIKMFLNTCDDGGFDFCFDKTLQNKEDCFRESGSQLFLSEHLEQWASR